jgi:nucleotide-binding universal stress UspA family protein
MPAPYATIACFIEGGPACRVVLDEAIALRAQSEGVLQVVHNEGPAARRWLDATVGDVPGAEPVMLTGYPPIAACDYAATANVDLVVAAAHRGIVNRTMLGGFASYVAYHAPCPVLLVHPPTPPAEG